MKPSYPNELELRTDLNEAELQQIPFATTEYVSLLLKHYSNILQIPEDRLFDGLTIDSDFILNHKDWIYGLDYTKLHQNAFKNQQIYLNFRLFRLIGARNFKYRKTLFKTFISLLTLNFFKKNASRILRLFNNTVEMEFVSYHRNKYYVILQSRPFAKKFVLGHECRMLEGMLTAFLQMIHVETISSKHFLCDKSLKKIVTDIYVNFNFDYREDERYIYINSKRIGQRVCLKSRCFNGRIVYTDQIEESSTKNNAIVIIEDFIHSGHSFFKKGEIFDAPHCVIDLEVKESRYFRRILRMIRDHFNFRQIMMEEIAKEIEISNRHLHQMHRLSEELRAERDSFEKKVEEHTLELIEANEQLQELNQRRADLMTNITHELRTPLTLIKSQIEAIREGMFGHSIDRNSDILTSIGNNSEVLYNITAEFLQFSQMESRKLELKIVSVKLDEFVIYILRTFEPLIRSHGLSCEFVNKAPGILINIDSTIFDKAISNLMTNAIKFTPSGGSILVKVFGDENDIRISVKDTGVGIPESYLSVIFERYKQVGPSNSNQGVGIGLALAKKIVELHKGRLSVTSKEGKGTDFTIHLPRQKEPIITAKYILDESLKETDPPYLDLEDRPIDDKVKPNATANEKKHNLLVVDDHSEMLNFLKNILQCEYNVFLSEDGTSALDIVLNNDIDVIVADIVMPGLDGTELVRKLRTNKKTDQIPILLLTAYSDFAIKMKSFTSGADDFLTKPFQPQELLARIRSLSKRADSLKEKVTIVEKRVTDQTRQAIQKSISYIKNHYTDNLSRNWLASEVDMSPDHFSRMFKKHTGKKLSRYINELRIDEVIQLIKKNPNTRIIDLAFTVGFENLRSFNKIFREIKGETPTQVKKNLMTNNLLSHIELNSRILE